MAYAIDAYPENNVYAVKYSPVSANVTAIKRQAMTELKYDLSSFL